MTVVIAALNKQAVAMAADSAVSQAAEEKVFNSANKIFHLSRRYPIGVAIYSRNEINGVPWETVIKEFRECELKDERLDHVADYARRFLEWLDRAPFGGGEGEHAYVRREVMREYRRIREEASGDDPAALHAAVGSALERFDPAEDVPADFAARVLRDHGKMLSPLARIVLGEASEEEIREARLPDVAVAALSSHPRSGGRTGLVFAGFGEKEFFPALVSWEVAGIASGYVRRRRRHKEVAVTESDPALVVPFAQTRDVRAVIDGIEPAFERGVEKITRTLAEGLVEQVLKQVTELGEDARTAYKAQLANLAAETTASMADVLASVRLNFRKPVYRIAAGLPKDELATMAETLVNITAFKRRLAPGRETVGGPVDVAVISRGDGFVWIKRKHYFPADLNPRFSTRHLQSEIG